MTTNGCVKCQRGDHNMCTGLDGPMTDHPDSLPLCTCCHPDYRDKTSGTVHVLPADDVIEHDTSTDQADCECRPRVQLVPSYGPDKWLIIHQRSTGNIMSKGTP